MILLLHAPANLTHHLLQVPAVASSEQESNQHSADKQTEAQPLQHSEDSQYDAASPVSLSGSGASRQPTEQEIQHMDELDLTMNFGSLLDPEDNWAVEDSEGFGAIGQAPHAGPKADGSKTFQELFAAGN